MGGGGLGKRGGGGGAGEGVADDDSILLGGRWGRPGELHLSLSSYCPKHLWSIRSCLLTLVDYYILTVMYGLRHVFLPVTFKLAESIDGLLLATVHV